MKYLRLSFVLSLLTLLVACNESSSSESTVLNVEPSSLTFSSEGGTASLSISSNTDWSITASNTDTQVVPSSGSGNKTVQVIVPKRQLVEQIESKLVIKSSDGAVIRNVSIIQEGLLISGGLLRFGNHSGSMAMDGKAHAVDSITIVSNAPWELRGEEWIEVYKDGRWVALSKSRAVISGNATATDSNDSDYLKLYIRTAEANNYDGWRQATLTLSQPYSGDMKCDLIVLQLGRLEVYPCNLVYLATGVATDWKYGADVKSFYWNVTKENLTDAELTSDKVTEWPSAKADPNMVSYWCGLEESTKYNIYVCVHDGQSKHWNSAVITTESSKNQAIAGIKNVYHDGSSWRWEIHPNKYCKLFYLWASTNQQLFYEPDVYIAWIVSQDIARRPSEFRVQIVNDEVEFGSYWWEINAPIQIVSWGTGHDGTKMASVISRYCTDDYNGTREKNNIDYNLKARSVKVDWKSLKGSFYRIK